jgi:RNA polymerase sigma factor (sigma-70 family)
LFLPFLRFAGLRLIATGCNHGARQRLHPSLPSWRRKHATLTRGSHRLVAKPRGAGAGETLSGPNGIYVTVTPDAELIRLSRADPDQFRAIYDRYAARIHAYFLRRTRDRDVALELTAETFAQAWTSRRRFRDLADGTAAPWLFAIARRVLSASVRKRRLETSALERLRVELPTRATNSHWRILLDDDLLLAVRDLPKQQREAVVLRVLGGFSYSAIAERVGCTATAARIRVSRGLKTLRARMETNEA